jgi:hypothetical protein
MSQNFAVITSIVLGMAGMFMLIGFSADSKKCVVCKNLGPEEYMNHHVGEKGKSTYTHQGCVLKVKS